MTSRKRWVGALGMLWLGLAFAAFQSTAVGVDPPSPHGVRAGGVLASSYAYHRGLSYAPLSAVPRYSYGFPVPSYKWGWFGAQHYYPRTTSHRGYNGDYWQWAYRRGW